MRTFGAFVVVALVACGGGIREVATSPSGEKIYETKCKADPHDCGSTAREQCDGGFEATSSESHAGGIAADALPGPMTWFSMTFRCGGSSELPTFPARGANYGSTAAAAAVDITAAGAKGFSDGMGSSSSSRTRSCLRDSDCFGGEVCVKTQDVSGACVVHQR